MAELSEKEAEIVKLKSQGLTNRAIAKVIYPDATQHAGDVLISRALKKPHVAQYVDKGREHAIKKYGITWDLLIAKLNVMLNAERTSNFTGEILPDYGIQLNALKTLIPMLEKKQDAPKQADNTDLIKALKSGGDEVELQRIVFNKNRTQNEDN